MLRITELYYLDLFQYEWKNDSSGFIVEMTSKEGYPRVEILSGSNELKITKSGFRKAY